MLFKRAGQRFCFTADRFAESSLAFYLFITTIMRLSTVTVSYPTLVELDIPGICNMLSLGLAVASLSMRGCRFNLFSGGLVAISVAVCLYSALRVEDWIFITGLVFVIAVVGMDFKRLAIIFYRTVLLAMIAIVLLALLGLIQNRDYVPNHFLVYGYGFFHPNTCAGILFASLAAMTYAYQDDEKKQMLVTVLSLVFAVVAYVFLSSYTVTILCVALLLGNIFQYASRRGLCHGIRLSQRFYAWSLIVIPLSLLAFMLVAMVLYDPENAFLSGINRLLHGRIGFAHDAFLKYGGFTRLGRKIVFPSSWHSSEPFQNVDSGYARTAITFGLFTMAVWIVIYVRSIRRLSYDDRSFLVWLLFICNSLYLLTETYPLYLSTNFTILLLSKAFSETSLAKR